MERPLHEQRPASISVLFQADHTAVSKSYRAAVGISGQEKSGQSLEVRKVADNQDIVGVNLEEIRRKRRIIVGIEPIGVIGSGGDTDATCEDMRGFFGSRLAAVLDQGDGDSQRSQEFRYSCNFAPAFIG
jgi:hypothetical protein